MEAKKMKHNLFNLQMFAVSSKDYWENREKEALKAYQKQEEEYDKEIERIYRDMLDAIQKEIDAFYTKYAKKEGITLAEAKKRVSKLDIEAYERKAKRYVKEASADRRANGGQTDFTGSYFSEQANEEMMLYNLTMKVNRLEMLKANIGLELIKGHNELENFMGEILQGRTMEELERQAGILGRTIKDNAKLAHTIPNASFHNATFSDRIWQYQSLMKADLSKTLQTALIQGKNPRAVASEVRKHLVGDKYGKGARGNIERLMRTELARVQTEAQKKSIEEAGFEMYMFICNEDGRTCEICQKAASKDSGHGKGIYLIKDMMPGTNAAPLHPNCRCSTAPHEDSKDYEAWLEHLEKGGTTEQWNKMKKRMNYKGIPSTWKKLGENEQIIDVNPFEKTNNCVNCTIAYEMRKRDKGVIAKEGMIELIKNPFAGWVDPDVIPVVPGKDAYEYIENAMALWGEGSRAQIAVLWNKNAQDGHSFVAEQGKYSTYFIDVQSGKAYNIDEIKLIFETAGDIEFCRIDKLDINDLGVSACMEG